MPVVKFGMAVNNMWKGERKSVFVDCVMFGKRAEAINQYMSKGKPFFVEGQLDLNAYTNKDGVKVSKLQVMVSNFEFMGKGSDGLSGEDRDKDRRHYDAVQSQPNLPIREECPPFVDMNKLSIGPTYVDEYRSDGDIPF